MNLGALIGLLKLAQDTGVIDDSKPTTTGWEVLTGAGVRDVEYTINLDPAKVAAWRERQVIVQAIHKIKSGFK